MILLKKEKASVLGRGTIESGTLFYIHFKVTTCNTQK